MGKKQCLILHSEQNKKEITMTTIKHWSEAITKWEEYKNTHTKEEIISDMEDFFSLDRDSEIAKMMAYIYYDVNCF